jgi:hypothetical protein
MSELRVHVRDKDGKELSFVAHYAMGCRLASAIDETTEDFETLLKRAYEFDKGIHDIKECMDNEANYKSELEYAKNHKPNFMSLKPYPNKAPHDGGIIKIDFPSKTIISDQSGDYIGHKGVRETWGYTGDHADIGRFKLFRIPDCWTIIDKHFFGKPTRIEGEIDKDIEQELLERVDWYKKRGYRTEVL